MGTQLALFGGVVVVEPPVLLTEAPSPALSDAPSPRQMGLFDAHVRRLRAALDAVARGDLAAAVSILTIEARHAGAIGYYNDPSAKMVSPNGAFDKPLTATTVLAAVTATKFIVS